MTSVQYFFKPNYWPDSHVDYANPKWHGLHLPLLRDTKAVTGDRQARGLKRNEFQILLRNHLSLKKPERENKLKKLRFIGNENVFFKAKVVCRTSQLEAGPAKAHRKCLLPQGGGREAARWRCPVTRFGHSSQAGKCCVVRQACVLLCWFSRHYFPDVPICKVRPRKTKVIGLVR